VARAAASELRRELLMAGACAPALGSSALAAGS
jgi:hypothetical protein